MFPYESESVRGVACHIETEGRSKVR